MPDPLLERKLYKLQKQLQRSRDEATVLRKVLREDHRKANYFEEVFDQLKDKIPLMQTVPEISKRVDGDANKIGIINLSDLHLGETVKPEDTKGGNEFNWEIASRRLQKFAIECKQYIAFHDINKVILCLGGDIFNSNRRMDELVRNSDSTSVAFLKGVNLLSKFIVDVTAGCSTKVYSVYGNESRMAKDYTSVHWEHSFDYLLHHILSVSLKSIDRIEFVIPTLDHSQVVRNALGANLLLVHGHNNVNYKNEIVKFAHHPTDPLIVHYVLHGHIHETDNKNITRRSSSLVGDNAYSFHRLGIHGSAEQNFHILIKENDKRVPILRSIAINLDCVDDYSGYNITEDCEITIDGPVNGEDIKW